MRGDDVTQPRRVERGEQRRRGLVVQVSEPARDALLERPWIVAVFEHAEIVIAFEHQRVAAGEARFDVARRRPDVGQHAEPMRAVAEDELHRLTRVVRQAVQV